VRRTAPANTSATASSKLGTTLLMGTQHHLLTNALGRRQYTRRGTGNKGRGGLGHRTKGRANSIQALPHVLCRLRSLVPGSWFPVPGLEWQGRRSEPWACSLSFFARLGRTQSDRPVGSFDGPLGRSHGVAQEEGSDGDEGRPGDGPEAAQLGPL